LYKGLCCIFCRLLHVIMSGETEDSTHRRQQRQRHVSHIFTFLHPAEGATGLPSFACSFLIYDCSYSLLMGRCFHLKTKHSPLQHKKERSSKRPNGVLCTSCHKARAHQPSNHITHRQPLSHLPLVAPPLSPTSSMLSPQDIYGMAMPPMPSSCQ